MERLLKEKIIFVVLPIIVLVIVRSICIVLKIVWKIHVKKFYFYLWILLFSNILILLWIKLNYIFGLRFLVYFVKEFFRLNMLSLVHLLKNLYFLLLFFKFIIIILVVRNKKSDKSVFFVFFSFL